MEIQGLPQDFRGKLQEALGTRLNFSTTFHPQTNGQSKRVIQFLEDMLRSCVIDYKGSWDRHIPLVEFVYNNSFQSSIGMAPYEALFMEGTVEHHCVGQS